MNRTNIVIDHDRARRLMRNEGLSSLREAVDFALRACTEPRSAIAKNLKVAREASEHIATAIEILEGGEA